MDDVSEILKNLSVCQSLVRKNDDAFTAIRIQTTEFEIIADCELAGGRISDVLNQSMTDYLDCTNANFYRHGQLIQRIADAKVRKSDIVIASTVGNVHEAAEKRIGSRRALQLFQAVAVVNHWVVKGRLHLTMNKTVNEFLRANTDFFAIAGASVIDGDSPENIQQMNVAIVNRARVSAMEISELPESEIPDAERSAIERLLLADATHL